MSKRPDYGDATPEDLAWVIMTGRPIRDRYPLSERRKAGSSQPSTEPSAASDPESQRGEDCVSQRTGKRSDQDA